MGEMILTETENGTNIDANNLNINCLTSKNNKFSLDSDGNLVVNTITANNMNTTGQSLDFNAIYPIGSIYMSVNNVNPSSLFGGTWEQIKDRFLLASGSVYSAGTTGGEAAHTLTVNEIPSHTHTFTGNSHNHSFSATTGKAGGHSHRARYHGVANCSLSAAGYFFLRRIRNEDAFYGTTEATEAAGEHNHTVSGTTGGAVQSGTNSNTGGSKSHNNMPPYLSVYVWKRVA